MKPEDKKQKLWTKPECAACMLNIGYLTLIKSTNDKKLHHIGMKRIYKILNESSKDGFSSEIFPTVISIKIFRMIQDLTENKDPFCLEKENSNKLSQTVSSQIGLDISKTKSSSERIFKAIIATIVGNIIDYGTSDHKFSLDDSEFDKFYYQNFKTGFKIDDFDRFLKVLNDVKSILYIVDNAGEIAFDKLLINELLALDKEVVVALKEGPISNDATIDDAIQVGLDKLGLELITTGSNALGIMFDEVSEQFINKLEKSDLIIAKGQANWETLVYYRERIKIPVLFILKVKCAPIAEFLGVNVGDNVLKLSRPEK